MLKDLLERCKTELLSAWQLFQKMFILMCCINKYNNAVHKSITIKPIDIRSGFYAEHNEGSNEKIPKLKVGDYVRI